MSSGSPALLQFGVADPTKSYADRPCAYGVLSGSDGRIALVRVERPEGLWRDLPGGALDPGEDELQALVREFGEETGLKVEPGAPCARAAQYMIKSDGAPVNNLSGFYEVALTAEAPALKIEDDHTLEWWEPPKALEVLRHDSHAWAVVAWMRRLGRPSAV